MLQSFWKKACKNEVRSYFWQWVMKTTWIYLLWVELSVSSLLRLFTMKFATWKAAKLLQKGAQKWSKALLWQRVMDTTWMYLLWVKLSVCGLLRLFMMNFATQNAVKLLQKGMLYEKMKKGLTLTVGDGDHHNIFTLSWVAQVVHNEISNIKCCKTFAKRRVLMKKVHTLTEGDGDHLDVFTLSRVVRLRPAQVVHDEICNMKCCKAFAKVALLRENEERSYFDRGWWRPPGRIYSE
jgi:hypothetical protein